MKILLISFNFAPHNSIGAVRVSKLARFLQDMGHELRVLTARGIIQPTTLPLEIDNSLVERTDWINVNFLPLFFFGGKKQVAQTGYSTRVSFVKRLGNLYQNLLNFPDEAIGWYPFAVHKGKKILKKWTPDIIYASALPATALLVACRLSRISGVKWVAELRDLWADSERYPFSEKRRYFDGLLEKSVLSNADAIVTVTDEWGRKLQEKYACPVCVSKNGFDPKDFKAIEHLNFAPANVVRIVYTGVIYPRFQDIEPFFVALSKLGEKKKNIRFEIYTRYMDIVNSLAAKYAVSDIVHGMGRVSYQDSLRAQMEADVLLLLGWGDSDQPDEVGNIPAKLFEYIGARRPILSVGSEKDIVSRIIRERNAGVASNDPEIIKYHLSKWVDIKLEHGRIPALPKEIQKGMTRQEQFEILEDFLQNMLSGSVL